MGKFIAIVAAAMVSTTAHAGQTAYTPPGGTTAQGTTGGNSNSPSALNVGVSLTYDRAGRWRSGEAASEARAGDVLMGSPVYSANGALIGKVAYADDAVAVVQSRRSALRLPVNAFGTQQRRLLLKLSPYQFERLAEKYGVESSR